MDFISVTSVNMKFDDNDVLYKEDLEDILINIL